MRKLAPLAALCLVAGVSGAPADPPTPTLARVMPLGGQRGTTIDLTLVGEYLANAQTVEFDCRDLAWEATTHASSGRLQGRVSILPDAALGPHMFRVRTADGYSTSAMFNVGQFPDLAEDEPNDTLLGAMPLGRLPVEIQGALEGAADIDTYAFDVDTGERVVAEMRSIEFGSAVEAKMFLLDASGETVAFNDDRDDYLETPLIDHTFTEGGRHYLKLDQYRGPRGFNFGKSSTYVLRVSALPSIGHVSPLGAKIGSTVTFSVRGRGLDRIRGAHMTALRSAEYARMTYPHTMPIRRGPDPPSATDLPRIKGGITSRAADTADVRFSVPETAPAGLWRLWASGPGGTIDGPLVELSELPEFSEATAPNADWRAGNYTVNGVLGKPGERDIYAIHAVAGRPLHFWTLATQLGVPRLDPVLSLRDAAGRRLAENDDIVAGQGTLIGNPDSSLFYTPASDDVLFLVVQDRTLRGGQSYQYRLKVGSEVPGFQLFTTPENFRVIRGRDAEIKVHLVREQGFGGRVAVWFEGLPAGMHVPRGEFRADQLFEPNADGADMIIPEIAFPISVPDSVPSGVHPIRVLGAPVSTAGIRGDATVEAGTTLTMGPLLDLWNFVRRPLPRIEMTVVEPPPLRLSGGERRVDVSRGTRALLAVKGEGPLGQAEVRVPGLPTGVDFEAIAESGGLSVALQASATAPLGTHEISVEARLAERWATTGTIELTVTSEARAERSK